VRVAGFAHAVALAVGDDGGDVVQEPVDEADGGGLVSEELAPVLEGAVAGAAEAGGLVGGGGDEPEQQLAAGGV